MNVMFRNCYTKVLVNATSRQFRRNYGGSIRFLDDNPKSGDESIFFRKESDQLLKNMLANHPEYDPKYDLTSLEKDYGKLVRDIMLTAEKHGISNVGPAFAKDLVKVFEAHQAFQQRHETVRITAGPPTRPLAASLGKVTTDERPSPAPRMPSQAPRMPSPAPRRSSPALSTCVNAASTDKPFIGDYR
eukprot:GHVU01118665.1.p2 GENE.GHVU01118665.1~~GHVU01118665.1.p2  ORF type:complete len:188 (+),score=15.99 GHVU01118665.1:82-645(+)